MTPLDKEQWRRTQKRWLALAEAARERLCADISTNLGPGLDSTNRLVQILALPCRVSLPADCWNVCVKVSRIDGKRYFVQHLTWRQDIDAQESEQADWLQQDGTDEPTFEQALIDVEGEFVESTLDRIRSLQIPAVAETEVQGIGGLFYELAIGEGFTSVRYHWWQEPPRGSRELHAIAEGIVEYVDSRADRGHTIQRENAADT